MKLHIQELFLTFTTSHFCPFLYPFTMWLSKVIEKHGQYFVGPELGENFYFLYCTQTNRLMGVKFTDWFENAMEQEVYRAINQNPAYANYFLRYTNAFIKHRDCIIIEEIGIDLERLVVCQKMVPASRIITPSNITLMALILLYQLKIIHESGFIYRSFKLEHVVFRLGQSNGAPLCCFIDFGKCWSRKRRLDGNKHDGSNTAHYCGYQRFAPLISYRSSMYLPKHDVESLCYLCITALTGVNLSKRMKKGCRMPAGTPPAFIEALKYTRQTPENKPFNYDKVAEILGKTFSAEGITEQTVTTNENKINPITKLPYSWLSTEQINNSELRNILFDLKNLYRELNPKLFETVETFKMTQHDHRSN